MKTLNNRLGTVGIILTAIMLVVTTSCKEDGTKENTNANQVDITPVSEKMTITPDTTQAVAMNPAHGQPGHRCDIPVGAPLNSPPANTNSTSPIITNSSSTNLNTGNANPKVNPPHGQPGHRCDVKVGDPL